MGQQVGLLRAAADADRAKVIDAFKRNVKAARDVAVVEYTCRDSLVLIVWSQPGGLLYYAPEYRISRLRIATEANEAGIANRSIDGVGRKWPERAGWVDEWRESAGEMTLVNLGNVDQPMTTVSLSFDLNCRHGIRRVLYRELVADVDAHNPRDPSRHRV